MSPRGPFAAGLLYVTVILILLSGEGFFAGWRTALLASPVIPAILWTAWSARKCPGAKAGKVDQTLLILSVAALFYLLSSAINDPFFFLLNWADMEPRAWGPMIFLWAAGSLLLSGVAWKTPRLGRHVACALPFIIILGASIAFYRETGFAPLYRDDHPSFLYRISVFDESFPQLIYYNPFWNGGRVATYAVASGAIGPGLLYLPFLSVWPIEQIYSIGLLVLFLGILPTCACFAVRQTGASWTASCLAAALAAGTSWGFFRWLFEFGTLGACFAGGFLLPVACLLYRLLYMDSFSWRHAGALILCSCLFLMWPGNWFISLTLVPPLLLSLPGWNRRRLCWIASCGAVITLFIAPLVISMLLRVDVGAFAEKGSLPSPGQGQALIGGLIQLAASLREFHPAILWFGILSLPVLRLSPHLRFIAWLILPLLILTGWGEYVFDGLSLSRAAVPLAFVAVWPAAVICARIVSSENRACALITPVLLSLLLIGGYTTIRFYGNKSEARYNTMPDETRELAEWIQGNTDGKARILFAGLTSHAYGGGHVAALSYFTGREMMAADYYHFSPRLVEYFYPPKNFREQDEDVYRFIELYNVDTIIAYDVESVVNFYRKYPGRYEELTTIPGKHPKTVFRAIRPRRSFFEENRGHIMAGINGFDIRLDDGDADAVIRYHYSEELSVSRPAELFPHEVDGISFIGIRPNGLTNIQVRFTRIL